MLNEGKKFKITGQELNDRLCWPVDQKMMHAAYTFLEFYIHYHGQVYQSFSGGKDSQVLDWIITEIFKGRWKSTIEKYVFQICVEKGLDKNAYNYQTIIVEGVMGGPPPKVFCDTGLEFLEIRRHVRTFEGVVWLRPKMKFPDVIKNVGVAVGSKHIAGQIARLNKYLANPTAQNAATTKLYLTGIKRDGTKSKSFGLTKRWLRVFTDAPFKVSDQCCNIFKKDPWHEYQNKTGRKPITGTTVVESMQRRVGYLQTGCNTFDKGKEKSRPISIFTSADVWTIAERFGIKFCEVYYARTVSVPDGNGGFFKVEVEPENRTGCMFCLFGIHLEPKNKPNRFQRMAVTHPKQYEFMLNECGLAEVLDFIGIPYKVTPEVAKQLLLEL